MNKIDFMLIFDVLDINPNGDPDAKHTSRRCEARLRVW